MSNSTFSIDLSPAFLFKDLDRGFLQHCKKLVDLNKDPAHDWKHIIDVASAAMIIAENEELPYIPLALAAIAHDTYSGIDRVNHHLLSGELVRDKLKDTIHFRWTEEVALCCEQHRASYTGEYTGVLQEAFASADRGLLHDDSICDIVTRSFKYSVGTGADQETAIQMVVKHIPEKFGHKGYAKWPAMYVRTFQYELERLKDAADSITISKIKDILNL